MIVLTMPFQHHRDIGITKSIWYQNDIKNRW